MAYCNTIIGLTHSCDDNNAGSIKKAYIASFEDVSFDPANVTQGQLSALTMEVGTYFHPFEFRKNTSAYTENWVGDLAADVHLWEVAISIGLRRIEVAKRNAISILAEGRRNLVVITEEPNGDLRVWGLDAGLNLNAMESGTNETRAAGTFYNITIGGQERWLGYYIDQTVLDSVTQ